MTSGRERTVRRCSAGAMRAAVAALVVVSAACGGAEDRAAPGGARGAPPENHATPVAADASHPSTAPDTLAPPCPPTGRWAECTVINRLEQAGLIMEPHQDPVTREPLQRQGRGFSVRSAELEVFIYPDRNARERDQARLDPDDYLEADAPPEPVHKPTIVASENLLVVLDTRRERQRERITLALTAGPPQP